MTFGRFEGPFPRVLLKVQGSELEEIIDFIVDTGFDGDIALPPGILRRIGAPDHHIERRRLASGPPFDCQVFAVQMDWNGESHPVDALLLDCEPLFGTQPMRGGSLHVELVERGEVVIEFPD